MGNRNFWLMSCGIGLLFSVDQALLASQVPFFLDMGFDLSTAALLVSVKTISAIGGKLLVGALSDKMHLRRLYACVAGCNVVLLTIYISQPSLLILLTSVALLGVAVGGVFPIWTTMLAWQFGSRSYGVVMGLMSIVIQVFAIVSMRFVGQVYDSTGSYLPAFSVLCRCRVVFHCADRFFTSASSWHPPSCDVKHSGFIQRYFVKQ